MLLYDMVQVLSDRSGRFRSCRFAPVPLRIGARPDALSPPHSLPRALLR